MVGLLTTAFIDSTRWPGAVELRVDPHLSYRTRHVEDTAKIVTLPVPAFCFSVGEIKLAVAWASWGHEVGEVLLL